MGVCWIKSVFKRQEIFENGHANIAHSEGDGKQGIGLKKLIVGLGETGQSILRFYQDLAQEVCTYDTRNPTPIFWDEIDTLIVSPGVPLDTQVLVEARKRHLSIIGDIELFYRQAKAPIIAITGTNAKSTVTTLVTDMINATGKIALMGGNIGVPALDLLKSPTPDYYVLELSSFQLDLVDTFKAYVGIILNISPDHLDRHGSLEAYRKAKERIYLGCAHPIHNQGTGELPFPVTELSQGLAGNHNLENARNALAITAPLGLPLAPQLQVLKTFKGLPHRCILVREYQGVEWYNDSKGTNVGATLAAIEGVGAKIAGKVILLLGGVAKEQDFKPLRQAIERYVRQVILYGQDRERIAEDLQGLPCEVLGQDFSEVLEQAKNHAESGDAVLLSPASASFDMFKNFEDRGEQFTQKVLAFNKTE